jgi:hypothetical protein
MKIKILRCSDSRTWYNKHIGEVLYVERVDSDRYWCRELDQYRCLNFVLIKDCEVHYD